MPPLLTDSGPAPAPASVNSLRPRPALGRPLSRSWPAAGDETDRRRGEQNRT